MLGVVGHAGEQLVVPGARLADFQQINAVGRVQVAERPPDGINRIGHVAKAVVGVGVKLGRAVIEHAADLRGAGAGADTVDRDAVWPA